MSLKRNVTANFVGSAWSALMGLAFVPLYIQRMGVESYGIVGVFSSLMAVLTVLDLGISQAMSREMARLSVDGQSKQQMADTARTLEIIYWGIAVVVGLLIFLLAQPIANYWLNPEQLARDSLRQAIQVMGLVIGLRWPVSLYMGGLNGMQLQVQVNVLQSLVAALQGIGAVMVLWYIAPTIQAFFVWQAVVALIQVVIFRTALWRRLTINLGASFDNKVLVETWRYAAGMSGISLLATVLTQLDKVVLSKLLTLSDFGYYTFSATVAGILFRLIGPVFTAYSPRLTELVAKGDYQALVKAYHEGSQLMVVATIPAAIVMFFFSKEILSIWTGNQDLVFHASLLIGLLSIGNVLNGLMHMPFALQLAYGWTKLAFYQNLVAVIIIGPAIYVATREWGAYGAASIWIVLNLGYLLIGIYAMHRRLLNGEKQKWYVTDTLTPLTAVMAMCIFARLILVEGRGTLMTVVVLFATIFFSTIAAVISCSALRYKFKYTMGWKW
jgi:O-antigen/teichoic acid export membrane protein